MDDLSDSDNFVCRRHIVIAELRDVDESVFFQADVDKHSESGDVVDLAGELHAEMEVVDGADSFVVGCLFDAVAGVASGFLQFDDDVGERGQSGLFGDVGIEFDRMKEVFVACEAFDVDATIGGDALDKFVAFGMYAGVVEEVLAARYAEESGTLLKCLLAHARHIEQVGAGLEVAVFAAI